MLQREEPLPEDEPYMTADRLLAKMVWWFEESLRCEEAGRVDRVQAIRASLLRPVVGLFARLKVALDWQTRTY